MDPNDEFDKFRVDEAPVPYKFDEPYEFDDYEFDDSSESDDLEAYFDRDRGVEMSDELEQAVQEVMNLDYDQFSSEEGADVIQRALLEAERAPNYDPFSSDRDMEEINPDSTQDPELFYQD